MKSRTVSTRARLSRKITYSSSTGTLISDWSFDDLSIFFASFVCVSLYKQFDLSLTASAAVERCSAQNREYV